MMKMATTIAGPVKLKEKLEELGRERDTPPEELIVTALDEKFSLLDPKERAEIHLELCEKYLSQAEEFLHRGDSVQASEKAWGGSSANLEGNGCQGRKGAE